MVLFLEGVIYLIKIFCDIMHKIRECLNEGHTILLNRFQKMCILFVANAVFVLPLAYFVSEWFQLMFYCEI